MIGTVIHIVIGFWVGSILGWVSRDQSKKWRVAAVGYWILFGLSILVGGLVIYPTGFLHWLLALAIVTNCAYVDNTESSEAWQSGDAADQGPTEKRGGGWQATAAAFLILAVIFVNLVMTFANKSEFSGLGLFFIHFFVLSPFFLAAPALLRASVRQEDKRAAIQLQYIIYALLASSWFLLIFIPGS